SSSTANALRGSAMSTSDVLIVILAAGASRRLGRPKQSVTLGGESVLRRQCRRALSAGIGPVSVVLGCDSEQHAQLIADLPLEIRINDQWREGMAASLRHAVDAAMRYAGCLIVQGDQYRITPNDLRTLQAAWSRAPELACMSQWGEYTGPPVIFPTTYYDSIMGLRGNVGARALLYDATRPAPLQVMNVRAMHDLDWPEDITVAQSWATGDTLKT